MVPVVARPHVLRHARDDAENKTEHPVDAGGAKQAAVAAFVHQHKHAQQKKAHQHDDAGGQPVRYASAQHRSVPKGGKRQQRCYYQRPSFDIFRPDMASYDRALELL